MGADLGSDDRPVEAAPPQPDPRVPPFHDPSLHSGTLEQFRRVRPVLVQRLLQAEVDSVGPKMRPNLPTTRWRSGQIGCRSQPRCLLWRRKELSESRPGILTDRLGRNPPN